MKPELRERLARLGPIRDVPRVASGSPADFVLSPVDGLQQVKTIPAITALAYRGMALATAKRAIEEMVVEGTVSVHVPTVENFATFIADLYQHGVAAHRIGTVVIDVKALRAKLGLTQAEFARRYALDIDTLQNWEQGRCQPDRPAQAYLRAIAAAPDAVAAAQVEAPA